MSAPKQADATAAAFPGDSGNTLALTILFAVAVPVATFVLLFNHMPGFLGPRPRGAWGGERIR